MAYSLANLQEYYERQRRAREKQERDERFYAMHGYYPSQAASVSSAQDAAEREWQALVSEMQGRMSEIRGSETARALEDYYRGVISGQDVPYTPETVATLSSRAAAPIVGANREAVSRLRASFAARGLGRSGGLGSLESRYLTDAATGAAQAAAGVRAQATEANYGARAAGASGLQGYYTSREQMLNELATGLAGLRAQRTYDPSQFLRPGQRQTPTTGGYDSYRPVPPAERRQVGTTAPTYRMGAGR